MLAAIISSPCRLRKIFSVTPIFGVDYTLEEKPADPNQSFVPRQEDAWAANGTEVRRGEDFHGLKMGYEKLI
jgi:hypothetical protein